MSEEKSLQEQVNRLVHIGIPEKGIRKAMLEKGFQESEIDQALTMVPPPEPPPRPSLEDQPPLEDQVKRLVEIGIDRQGIRKAMLQKGFPADEVHLALEAVPPPPLELVSNTTKALYAGSMVLSLIVAFILLPITATSEYTILLTFLLGGWFTASVGFFVNSFKSRTNRSGLKTGAIVVSFLAFALVFIYYTTARETNELKTFGKVTLGSVVDGSSRTSRRSDDSKLVVVYKHEDGREFRNKVSVSKHEFSNHYLGEKVLVLYSTRFPNIVKLIRNNEIEKYREQIPQSVIDELLGDYMDKLEGSDKGTGGDDDEIEIKEEGVKEEEKIK